MLNDTTVQNQFAYAVLLSRTSGLFRSAGRGRATLTRKSMPSRLLATVRSCMNGLFGSRLRSSRFICHKVSRQSSSTILLRQFRISSSTLTLFRPPRGLSSILPSRMYLSRYYGSCCRSVHSKSIRDKQVIFSIVLKGSCLTILWRCSSGILFVFCFFLFFLFFFFWGGGGVHPAQSFTN